ncbi:MAG: BatA domain-containing protein [Candidatus Nanohaloarchaea archaeon]
MIQGFLQSLSGFFLTPIGLLAALGLIPLLIFYLVKKKPEKETMPSMSFFMQKKKSGKAYQAFRRLKRNLLLLFHVLIVLGMAAAIAQPYITQEKPDEKAVIVIDRSASTSDEFQKIKSFAKKNLGQQNTVLVAGEDTDVKLESAPASHASSFIDSLKPGKVEADIGEALQQAKQFEGKIVLASDLQGLKHSDSFWSAYKSLKAQDRPFTAPEIGHLNSWGFIEGDFNEDRVKLSVKNFRNSTQTVQITGSRSKTLKIPGNEIKTVKFQLKDGKNTFKLEKDEFEADNSFYAFKPENSKLKVVLIGEKNRYLRKTFELINFTSFKQIRPPVRQEVKGDVYIIGDSQRIISGTVRDLEKKVKSGKAMVFYGSEQLLKRNFASLPVEKTGEQVNKTVELIKPVKTRVDAEITQVKKLRGERLTRNSNTVIKADFGNGKILYYDLDDSNFRYSFIYPVFWKETIKSMTDRPEIQDRNLETGEKLDKALLKTGEEGKVTLTNTGFKKAAAGGFYAVNIESIQESSPSDFSVKEISKGSQSKKRSVQNLASILLALLLLGELAYLKTRGELK